MAFDRYFDLTLREETEIPQWDLLGAVWREVHRASGRTGIPFAVAFPKWMTRGFTFGETLRIFTESDAAVQTLYDAVEFETRALDFATGSRVRIAKDPARFEAYRMHRLPSGVSKTSREIPLERRQVLQEQARQRRLVQQQGLPSVPMRSSTGHPFRLTVERMDCAAETPLGKPNGYGLSRETQIVPVPVV